MLHILQQLIIPGFCVTLLAPVSLVPAIWPAIVTDKDKRWVKATLSVAACGLAVGEICVIRQDRAETFREHVDDMRAIFDRFTNLDQTAAALLKNQTVSQRSPAAGNALKRHALDLAGDILQFLLSREVVPGFGQGRFGEGPYGGKPADTTEYDKETVNAYLQAYEPQVATTYEAMKKRGFTEPDLEKEYANPVNTYSIRDTAQRLTALASQMPD